MQRSKHFRMHRIGISGWTYAGWRGRFYPPGLAQRRELEFASREFDTIEINGTHYSLQRPSSFELWREQTPDGFVFSIKGSRFITHMKQLRNVETALANFFASGVLALREKLGPFLWQLPPRMKFDAERMESFLTQLPRDTHEASRLAKRHDDKVSGRSFTAPGGDRELRHCVEPRHEGFMVPEFFKLLRKHKMAFVFSDSGGRWPWAEDLTADFVYARLHGSEELYSSSYTDGQLDWWASRLQLWMQRKQPADAKLVTPHPARGLRVTDTYVYFDNDAKVQAPGDARRLRERLAGH